MSAAMLSLGERIAGELGRGSLEQVYIKGLKGYVILMSVGEEGGKELFPDIVVVRRPGVWLQMMAEVETADTLTDETALNEWKPLSKVGELFVYVPMGHVPETKALLKKHKIKVAGIRTWRFRPVWGLDVTEA